mmetsp:Transcript_54358/g.119241  ORF Transcript_54358/g.119241 Transcript_54358/m.119241 type:complete len:145 (+) Transcript_54358:181-615(+)
MKSTVCASSTTMVVAITSLVVLILLDDQVAKWATCEQVRELLSSLPASLMVETLILTAMAVVIASFLPRTKRFFTACARMLNRTKRTVTIAVSGSASSPCARWNSGSCKAKGGVCRFGHFCKLCGGSHRSVECPSVVVAVQCSH